MDSPEPVVPRAILKWVNGFESPPVIYPVGGSMEEDQQIIDWYEQVLAGVGRGRLSAD